MDLFQSLLNLTIPPVAFFMLLVSLPTLAFARFAREFLGWFLREDMRGKVVLITGASSSIGEHVTYQYARRGAVLVLVARKEERLRAIAERARKMGAFNARIITGDVTKEEDCKRLIDETIHHFGHLDHLVNNAEISHSGSFEAMDTSSFSPVMDITFWGNIYTTFHALPHLRRTKGKIVVNSSVSAWLPIPRMSIYNAAKAGIYQLYETLRVELGPAVGITIVIPGYVESEMTKGKFMRKGGRSLMDDEHRDIHAGAWPTAYAETCAKSIVNGAIKGQRYVRVPAWYSVFALYRLFAPEILDWVFRLLYVHEQSHAQGEQYNKATFDVTEAK